MTSRSFTTPYPLINVMSQAAFKAGRGLIRDFGEVEQLQISRKGPGDFVSKADQRAEKTIYLELSKVRPDYAFLMEEFGAIEGEYPDSPTWIVDPLDGTTNFLHGIPHFAVSIGLKRQDEIIAGVIYDPLQDELFWAEKGSGAFMNDRRLRVSARKSLQDAVIGTGLPFVGRAEKDDLRGLEAVRPHVAGIRQLGSAALGLAYVAAGRFEGYWEANLASWDLAAGLILVKEAGGWISDLSGSKDMKSILEKGEVLACNTDLFTPLQKRLKSA
jgi:myo-inositol-1(or 4)-monophosphatase